MKYIFYSYYLTVILKGKYKAIQISVSIILMLMVVILGYLGIINFITGKPVVVTDVLFLVLFIYSLMNVGYSALNDYSPETVLSKVKIENNLPEGLKQQNSLKGSVVNSPILINKRYTTEIKSSPKVVDFKKEEIKSSTKIVTNKENQTSMSVPLLEINVDSTQKYFEKEREEFNQSYSGIIDANYEADISDVPEITENKIIETPFPNTGIAFFEENQFLKTRFKP